MNIIYVTFTRNVRILFWLNVNLKKKEKLYNVLILSPELSH